MEREHELLIASGLRQYQRLKHGRVPERQIRRVRLEKRSAPADIQIDRPVRVIDADAVGLAQFVDFEQRIVVEKQVRRQDPHPLVRMIRQPRAAVRVHALDQRRIHFGCGENRTVRAFQFARDDFKLSDRREREDQKRDRLVFPFGGDHVQFSVQNAVRRQDIRQNRLLTFRLDRVCGDDPVLHASGGLDGAGNLHGIGNVVFQGIPFMERHKFPGPKSGELLSQFGQIVLQVSVPGFRRGVRQTFFQRVQVLGGNRDRAQIVRVKREIVKTESADLAGEVPADPERPRIERGNVGIVVFVLRHPVDLEDDAPAVVRKSELHMIGFTRFEGVARFDAPLRAEKIRRMRVVGENDLSLRRQHAVEQPEIRIGRRLCRLAPVIETDEEADGGVLGVFTGCKAGGLRHRSGSLVEH